MTTLQRISRTSAVGTIVSGLTSTGVFAQSRILEGIEAANTGETTQTLPDIIKNIVNVLLFVVGVASVIMLIIGGIRYTLSGGDQSAVANAKNTILYAIVGVVVALLAYAAINYVFGVFSGTA